MVLTYFSRNISVRIRNVKCFACWLFLLLTCTQMRLCIHTATPLIEYWCWTHSKHHMIFDEDVTFISISITFTNVLESCDPSVPKPLHYIRITYCQLDPHELPPVKFNEKDKDITRLIQFQPTWSGVNELRYGDPMLSIFHWYLGMWESHILRDQTREVTHGMRGKYPISCCHPMGSHLLPSVL